MLAIDVCVSYIGPGAGLVVVSSFFVMFWTTLLVFLIMFTWPIRFLIRLIRRLFILSRSRIRKVIILGIDGMDPALAEKFMTEGKLPHLASLSCQGCFKRLQTTVPPISPVAWSSFQTGCNPGRHNIFDFLSRDLHTCQPTLSSVDYPDTTKKIKIGPFQIPLTKSRPRLLRKGKPFWYDMGKHGIFSHIIRVPITFPPEKFYGVSLAGMCVPDLQGSQGTFSFYTTRKEYLADFTAGQCFYVQRRGRKIKAQLTGPANPHRPGQAMKIPFTITICPDTPKYDANLKVNGNRYKLKQGSYSQWIPVEFKTGLGKKIHGICQMLLLQTEPELKLYVSPVHIDPEKPVMPVSHPSIYATYLSKRLGRFATLGLAENTWALNAGIISDNRFLDQCQQYHSERETMLFDALDKTKRGLCVCVFDGLDRVQHTFWRHIDPEHPAHDPTKNQHTHTIEEWYRQMDRMVGKVVAQYNRKETLILVISDHGFNSFRYGIDLNRWLEENGYLKRKINKGDINGMESIDWSQTTAYAVGLAGIYLNLRGREKNGIIPPGPPAQRLRQELSEKLTGLTDPIRKLKAINNVYDAAVVYQGPYQEQAPDLIVGYNRGYRVAWETTLGQITNQVFHENKKAWSGDHCVDPVLVPGVLFSNRLIKNDRPRIMDIGPTVLELFGVAVPKHMDGKPLDITEPTEIKKRHGDHPSALPHRQPLPRKKEEYVQS